MIARRLIVVCVALLSLVAAQTQDAGSEMTMEDYFRAGAEHYIKGAGFELAENYDSAYVHYAEAIKMFVKRGHRESVYKCCMRMGIINHHDWGFYDLAYEQYDMAYQVALMMQDYALQMEVLREMIDLRHKQGLYDKENELKATLDEVLKQLGTMGQASIDALIAQGDEAKKLGRYADAKVIYLDALNRVEASDLHNNYIIKGRLRDLCASTKDFEEAVQYSTECVDLWKINMADLPAQKYLIYRDHCMLQQKVCDEKGCLASLDSLLLSVQAMDMPTELANYYFDKASVLSSFGRHEAACDEYENAEKICSNPTDVGLMRIYMQCLPMHASSLYKSQRFAESADKYSLWVDLVGIVHGTSSHEYAEAEYALSQVLPYAGKIAEGANAYQDAMAKILTNAAMDLKHVSPNQRGKYWSDISNYLWGMTSYALAGDINENEFTSTAYEALVFSKNLLMTAEKNLASVIDSSFDAEAKSQYAALVKWADEYERLKSKGQNKEAMEAYAEMTRADHKLASRLAAIGLSPNLELVTAEDVISSLDPDEAVVDFVDFAKLDGKIIYAAYIVRGDKRHPIMVKLGLEDDLLALVKANKNNWSRIYDKENSAKVMQLIWNPLEAHLKGVKRVYLVPSGIINQIAVESLQLANGTLLGDKDNYDIRRLSSAREIANGNHRKNSIASARRATLYGGLAYDVPVADMVEKSKKFGPVAYSETKGDDFERGDSILLPLKYSAEEVDAVKSTLEKRGIKVDCLKDANGTEESVYKLNGKAPDILLFSTHGFYFSKDKVPGWSSLNGYENPMHRSGLAMSGANAEWLRMELPQGVCGGLLKANEIEGIDLGNAQLVVLSACKTALGETNNEGVYGLQRAFKKAGVQTLIVSLWSVNDKYTKDFMIEFFKNLASNGWNKHAAFREAQAKMRAEHENPYCWAGFVMID